MNTSLLTESIKMPSKHPIIVYQMGKVGSFSIYMSLKEIRKTHHVHYLREDIVERLANMQSERGFPVPGHLETSQMVNKKYMAKATPVKYIVLVRDPISRNMSAFFENLDNFIINSEHKFFKIPEVISDDIDETASELLQKNKGKTFDSSFALLDFLKENLNGNLNDDIKQSILKACFTPDMEKVEKLINKFMQNYNHKLPTYWFDVEPKKVLGFDVYSENFDHEKGFITAELEGGSSILVMKCELSNEAKEKIISDYLDIEDFEIKNHNQGHLKHYQSLYSEFKKKIVFPDSYFDELLDSKFTKHFYSPKEIQKIKDKWQSNN